MTTQPRWIKTLIDEAAACDAPLPWERKPRRAAAIAIVDQKEATPVPAKLRRAS